MLVLNPAAGIKVMKRKHRKLWSVAIVLSLISIAIFNSNDTRAAVYSCNHTIKSFNVSPSPALSTAELNLKVVVNRGGTVCIVPGKTSYKADFYYAPAPPASGRAKTIGIQRVTSYLNGDTEISLIIVPEEESIGKGSYIFWAEVYVVQNSLDLKSDEVRVEINDPTKPKFSCNNDNRCVSDDAGRYATQSDCQRECGRRGGGGGGGDSGGGGGGQSDETIIFDNPIANDDLIGLVKSIAAWIYKLAIPVAVVAIIYGGGLLMLSQGNPKMIERGRKVLLYAVIGLVIIFIGQGFFTLIKSILDLGNR